MVSGRYIVKLGFRNVFRNKRRSFLTATVVMISVAIFLFVQSYFEGIMINMVEDSVKMTGHMYVQHPEYKIKERMMSLNVTVENSSELVNEIEKVPGVMHASQRIKFGGLLDFGESNEPGLGMGIQPGLERDIMQLENSIISGRYFSDNQKETVIGVEIARKLGISLGDTITVISRTAFSSLAAENLVVVGIADLLSSLMNRIFYLDIETARMLLDMPDQSTELCVYIGQDADIDAVNASVKSIGSIADDYVVYNWNEGGMLQDMMPILEAVIGIMLMLFGLIAGFIIINTMLMAVLERTNEIGVMTAFGMKKYGVMSVFLTESVVIALFGGIVGLLIGGGLGYWLETSGLTLGSVVDDFPIPIRQTIYGDLQLSQAVNSFLFGVIVSILAALLPALKAARMQPTDALRRH